jgi:Icc-related predicted phosphoesterase
MTQLHILHLSDIHLGTIAQARTYRSQLEADLKRELCVEQLDVLVISGDIANRSMPSEYEAAFELVNGLMVRFGLSPRQVVIVPGNHDLNWALSKKAYKFVHEDELPDPLPEGGYIPAGDVGGLLRDDRSYQKRFRNFSQHFYEKLYDGMAYPDDYAKQARLYLYPDVRLLFLALNSSWEIDHHTPHRQRSGINSEALAYALDQLMDRGYEDWLKIAVWHHPVTGPEVMKRVGFLEQLVVNGFRICMHGHIHEAIEGYHKYDGRRGLRIIGAGTFGAPLRDQPGIPLQYNLLVWDQEQQVITVKTRRKEKPDGAWMADARWGDRNNPVAWYEIPLATTSQDIAPPVDTDPVKPVDDGLGEFSYERGLSRMSERLSHTLADNHQDLDKFSTLKAQLSEALQDERLGMADKSEKNRAIFQLNRLAGEHLQTSFTDLCELEVK